MDQLTRRNRDWLDGRYAVSHGGDYLAHQPIYGYGQGITEPHHLVRLCRTLNLFRSLLPLNPRSILDVGGGEGYSMSIARHLLGCEADGPLPVVTTDLAASACQRAREFWGLRSAAVDAADLPFADGAFDLVWCSEVIEHLAHPFATLAELLRVAKRYVLLSTAASWPWALHREAYLLTREPEEPHFDRNIWVADDFRALFDSRCVLRPQYALALDRAVEIGPEAARRLVLERTAPEEISARTEGLIVIVAKTGVPIPPRVCDRDEEILDVLFRGPLRACPKRDDSWSEQSVEALRCPDCRSGPTLESGDRIVCPTCRRCLGPSNDLLDLLPCHGAGHRVPEEKTVVRELVKDPVRQAYLLRLVDRFEIRHLARSRTSHTFYRVLRRFLKEIRWAPLRL